MQVDKSTLEVFITPGKSSAHHLSPGRKSFEKSIAFRKKKSPYQFEEVAMALKDEVKWGRGRGKGWLLNLRGAELLLQIAKSITLKRSELSTDSVETNIFSISAKVFNNYLTSTVFFFFLFSPLISIDIFLDFRQFFFSLAKCIICKNLIWFWNGYTFNKIFFKIVNFY